MRGRLNVVMKPDPHAAENGSYMVRSIYFDNSEGSKSGSGNMPNTGDSVQDSGDSNRQQPSFSGVPDRPGGVSNMKNLITYGICLVVMLAALILAARFRRRKTK